MNPIVAIPVAVIAVFILSFVYYSVLDTTRDDGSRPELWKILLELLRSLIVATALWALLDRLDLSLGGALLTALALFAAFPAVLLAGSVIWEGVKPRVAVLHAGDWLLKLLVITLIVSL